MLEKLLELSEVLLSGEFDKHIPLDITEGNELELKIFKNLQKHTEQLQNQAYYLNNSQLDLVLDTITFYVQHDFNHTIPLSEKFDSFDTIATGINILGEELGSTFLSKEEHLASLNALPYVVWSSNIEFTEINFVNDKVKEIFGLDPKQLVEFPNLWVDIIHPEDKELVEKAFDAFLISGDFNIEYRIIQQESKEIIWINDIANFLTLEDGTRYRILGSCKDITDKKHFELENKLNQTRLEEAQRISKVGNWELDFKTNNLFWSKEHFDIFEIPYDTPTESLYEVYRSKIHPEDFLKLDPLVEKTINTGQPFEFNHRVLLSNNQEKHIRGLGNATIGLSGEIVGIKGTAQDISTEKKQEKQLNDALIKLDSIVNSTEYAIVATDLEGTIVLFNHGAEKLLGYSSDEVLYKINPSIFHLESEMIARTKELSEELGYPVTLGLETFHAKASKTGIPDSREWTYVRKDGSHLLVSLSVNTVLDLDGNVQGYLGISKDISKEKEQEENLKNALKSVQDYKTALNQIAIVSISDVQGNIIFANEMFSRVSGYSEAELIGKNHRILKSDKNPPTIFEELWESISSGKTWRGELCNVNKFGEYYWVDTLIVPFLDHQGKPSQYFSIRYEITEKKEQERLEQNNIDLQKDKEIAEQKTKVKERFLANMSHEIRTPMNSILGLSNLMEKVGTLNPKQMDYMKTIKLNSKNLLNIINDILDLSKIEEGKLELEKTQFNAKELVKNVEKSLHLIAHKKKIELTSTIDEAIPSLLIGDSTRLNQVLINLTNNAIKFTPEGSVQLNLRLVNQEDHFVRLKFEIQDTGIGIEASKLGSIFDPFTQETASTTRLFGGTGLGLSISNQIVHAFNSQIYVESEPSIGSTFYFELLLEIADKQLPELKNVTVESMELTGKYRILLVEDNPFNQMVAEDTLKDWNGELEIDIAENGVIALEKLKRNVYDLILMDIQMPEMDGHEATRKARQELAIRTPILAMTAQATPAEIEACMHSGMNDYISKPFQEEVLFSKITHWLQTDFLM